MEILTLLATALLQYGAIGLLAIAGWSLAGWLLWRDFRRKEETSQKSKEDTAQLIKAKEELAQTIAALSEARITDLKEISEDYNTVANTTIHTLDKLTTALNVVKYIG